MYIPSPSVSLSIGTSQYLISKWHLHPKLRIKTIIEVEFGGISAGDSLSQALNLDARLIASLIEMKNMDADNIPNADIDGVVVPKLEEAARLDGKNNRKQFKECAKTITFLIDVADRLIRVTAAERYPGGGSAGFEVAKLSYDDLTDDSQLTARLKPWISSGLVSWLEQSKFTNKRR